MDDNNVIGGRLVSSGAEIHDFSIGDLTKYPQRLGLWVKRKSKDATPEEHPSYLVEMKIDVVREKPDDVNDISDSDILASIACSYLLLVKEEVTSDIEVVRYLWPVLRSSVICQSGLVGITAPRIPVVAPSNLSNNK